MKDWLGNEFGVGDKVIYAAGSGRSITMVVGEVTRVWEVYRDHDNYEWAVLPPGEQAPFKKKWNQDIRDYVDLPEREKTVARVQVKPLRSSRWKQHYGDKPVTITVTKNITKWTGEVPDD